MLGLGGRNHILTLICCKVESQDAKNTVGTEHLVIEFFFLQKLLNKFSMYTLFWSYSFFSSNSSQILPTQLPPNQKCSK